MTKTKPKGYSYNFMQEVLAADSQLIGVQLGQWCIQNNCSAIDAAKRFGVSRQSVYAWFTGKFQPSPEIATKITTFLASVSVHPA